MQVPISFVTKYFSLPTKYFSLLTKYFSHSTKYFSYQTKFISLMTKIISLLTKLISFATTIFSFVTTTSVKGIEYTFKAILSIFRLYGDMAIFEEIESSQPLVHKLRKTFIHISVHFQMSINHIARF